MSAGRAHILGAIRASLRRGALDGTRTAPLDARLKSPGANLIPARADLPRAGQIELFVQKAEGLAATVARVPGADAVPAAIADYLAERNLPSRLRIAPDDYLRTLPWSERPLLTVVEGRADPADAVSVTPAFAAVAETGTLMLISGAATPTTLNFLPDVHIVVLRSGQLVGPFEDAWKSLRRYAESKGWPRAVNFISGPSRTADIGQELIMGAHGPRRLHIVLVDDEEAAR
jgi:L-lactate dehydrogenase complex protein LldG